MHQIFAVVLADSPRPSHPVALLIDRLQCWVSQEALPHSNHRSAQAAAFAQRVLKAGPAYSSARAGAHTCCCPSGRPRCNCSVPLE